MGSFFASVLDFSSTDAIRNCDRFARHIGERSYFLAALTVTLYSPGNFDFLPLVCVPTILNFFVDVGSAK